MGRLSDRVLRELSHLSFCMVAIFFAVFLVIVLSEIFLIAQSSRSRGGGSRPRADHDEGMAALGQSSHSPVPLPAPVSSQSEKVAPSSSGPTARLSDPYKSNPPLSLREAEATFYNSEPEDDYLVDQGLSERGRYGGGYRGGQGPLPPPFRVSNNPTIPAKDGEWQSVAGSRYKFFVFSAYYDWRGSRVVRVIGATKTSGADRVWCLLWYTNRDQTEAVTIQAKVQAIRENWGLEYSAVFVLCPLESQLPAPSSVSIVTRDSPTPSNRLRVNNNYPGLRPNPTPPAPDSIAICIQPLHYNYNKSLQLLEYIELNSLLGMEHITFYNHSISPSVSCILEQYASEGKVTVFPWKLDMVNEVEIRIEGIFAALNDCLYRSMYRFGYVALIDVDEIIMPRHNDTIQDFLHWMGTRLDTTTTGAYSFRNAFFYLQWPDDPAAADLTDPFERNLITVRKSRRRVKLHPHGERSKYICRPEYLFEAGNHFVWEFVPGHGTVHVPPEAAIMNHYRVCEFGGDDCVKSASLVDRTAYRYRHRLAGRLRRRWTQLADKCAIPPPSLKVKPKP